MGAFGLRFYGIGVFRFRLRECRGLGLGVPGLPTTGVCLFPSTNARSVLGILTGDPSFREPQARDTELKLRLGLRFA